MEPGGTGEGHMYGVGDGDNGKHIRGLGREQAKDGAEIPGANFSLTQPIIDNVTEAVTGSPADLAVIISGGDLQRLRTLAGQTLAVLRQIPGAWVVPYKYPSQPRTNWPEGLWPSAPEVVKIWMS